MALKKELFCFSGWELFLVTIIKQMCAVTVKVIFSHQIFCTSFNHLQSPELSRTPNTNDTKLDLSSFIIAKVVEDDEALQFLGGKHSFVNACCPKMDFKTLGDSQAGSFAVLFRCRSRRKIA